MKGNKQSLKRFLALLLSVAMIITYMPSGFITYAEPEADQPAVTEEVVKDEPAKEETPAKVETPAEETQPEVVEETPAEESSAEVEETQETPAPETPAEDEASESTAPSEDPAVTDEQVTEDEEEPEKEVEYPAQDFQESTSDTLVTVHAPKGELPEGTTMHVKNVAIRTVQNTVQGEMGEDVKVIKAIDITFKDADGKEIEPKGNKALQVSFSSAKFADKDNLSVVHIDKDENAEKVSDNVVQNNGEEVAFKIY